MTNSTLPAVRDKPSVRRKTPPSYLIMHIVVAWCLWFANLYASMSLIIWLPSIVVQVYHYSVVNGLKYTLVITTCGFAGRVAGVWLLDKTSRKFSLGYALLLAAASMMALGYIRNVRLAMMLGMCFYFFNEQAGVSQMAYIPELFPTGLRVKGNAWCSASARIVAATSPIVIGYLLAAKHYQSIATVLSMSLFIPWLVFVIWAPEMRGRGLTEVDS